MSNNDTGMCQKAWTAHALPRALVGVGGTAFCLHTTACLLNDIFCVPKTRFKRSAIAQGMTFPNFIPYQYTCFVTGTPIAGHGNDDKLIPGPLHSIAAKHRPAIDYTNYEPRTWKDDLATFHGKPKWS